MRLRSLTAIACIGLMAMVGCSAPPNLSPASALASTAVDPAAPRPNIIVFMVDDLGYADVSAYGINRLPTPNIDRIGNDGVKFTDAYVTAPVCAPSRAALNTGRYQNRFGFEFNNGPASRDSEERLGLPTSEVTIAQELKSLGYTTGLIGKWHLGSNDEHYPTNRGFDDFVGILTGATMYIDPTVPGVRSLYTGEAATGAYITRGQYNQVVEGPDREVVHNEREYLTDYFGRRAVESVRSYAAADNPYFLYLGFTAPHDPMVVTEKYYNRFPHIESELHRIYAAMVSALDDAVGTVLDAVEASGEADNTIIFFLSDNGCAAYYPGMCSCEPLRGGKLSHYEGGVRVPFLMRWPAELEGGQVFREVSSSMDIFPTLIEAAGGKLRTDRVYDGVDLMPFLKGERAGPPHTELVWRRQPMVSIRKGDWKLWKSLTGEYTLLFNLKDDLNEASNVAAENPEIVRELEAAIEQWGEDMVDPAWPSRPANTYSVCGTPFTLPI